MTRGERIFAVLGLALLLTGWLLGRSQRYPERDVVLDGSCGIPATIFGPTQSNRPTAIIFHGLAANRKTVRVLGKAVGAADMTVYLLDLPGHGDSTTPFTFERAESCAVEAIDTLERSGQIQLDKTVLIGHSLGGALAIRLADYFPTAATVAISPAPLYQVPGLPPRALFLQPPRRMPVNFLVITGQFDFPFLKRSADELIRAAGGERFRDPGDFLERRAIRHVTIPAATHTSLIFDGQVRNIILTQWLPPILPVHSSGSAARFFWGPVIGLVGLAFLVPALTSLLAASLHAPAAVAPARVSAKLALFAWLAAALLSVTALKLVMPLRFLHLYSGDYLASFLLLCGVLLSIFIWREQTKTAAAASTSTSSWQAIAVGGVVGILVMLAFGSWLNWALTDAWLNAVRWLRFPLIALVCLPYTLAEESALPAPGDTNWSARTRRFALFAALRFILWLSILLAVYVFSSGQVLLSILVLYMGTFSLFTRLGADAVRRRTDSPAGAAVFTAILMAWFIASVFPLI